MPELPEVETIRLGVERRLRGRTLTDIELHSSRATRHEADLSAYAELAGRRVLEVARRGKFLWLVLEDSPRALVLHLGMSGQLLALSSPLAAPLRHAAATLLTDDGGALAFVDQRTFGYLRTSPLLPTPDERPGGQGTVLPDVPEVLAHIARDPLDPHLDTGAAAERMGGTASAIKRVLLDQRYVSGIGNIYADEALWAIGLHPEVPAAAIPQEQLWELIRTAAEVMRAAVEVGGTSFDALYVDTEGEAGYFARELAAYGQRGAPCRRCGTLIEKLVVGGRATYVCPSCQTRGWVT
ncbi:MAG TPA: bifunctional DNA-formamidopyrimidine glycosylase/DNA-(apurinic or apyrimidinic site) lyase [Actinomycetales bacterium]|nr:bifunctional DNA-formamidopyrimidine glycosylase/DNA-(apurinic or apyrimidinic site) lyase [Actinomycetales bacterium]